MTYPNYFGSVNQVRRPCECCEKPISADKETPSIYGGGRFCSELCSKLRTNDKYLEWLQENPEMYRNYLENKGLLKKEVDKTVFDRSIQL